MNERSSGANASDTLHPPPSPYPQHVDPSPVDSNGTMIDEDAQEGEGIEEQEETEIRSPGDMEISSPNSQTSQDMVRTA